MLKKKNFFFDRNGKIILKKKKTQKIKNTGMLNQKHKSHRLYKDESN